MVNFGQKTAQIAICVALFAVALLLRATGADYGFFHGDERINDAARFLAGELVPSQHFYPPFFNYLNGVALAVLYPVGVLTDLWSNTGEFRQAYFSDPTPFYLAARYLTAALSALTVPLFFMCARRVGLAIPSATAVASAAVVLPIGVYMAHIAKGDTGLAFACVAVIWAFLMRIDAAKPRRWDIAIGIIVALAFGFKQSALLVLAPMAIAMLVVLAGREGLGKALKSFGLALLVLVVLWPIMNVGILLDIEGFLAFQNIQSVMSVREEDGFGSGLPLTLSIFGDITLGLNPIVLAMACVAPIWFLSSSSRLEWKGALFALWVANAVSVLGISLLVGTRQPEHLFIANLFIFLLLASLATVDVIRVFVRLPRYVMSLVAMGGFGLMVMGALNVVTQAAVQPNAEDLATYLATEFPEAKIQSALVLPVPQTKAAQQVEFDRFDRLGEKYDIAMPEIAPERFIVEDADNALFWVNAPFVMSGLEDDAVQDGNFEIQAHAWPVQPDEWVLDNRLSEGFTVFVVNNFVSQLNENRSTNVRAFHAELEARCGLAKEYPARKPLFLEFDITVFDCTNA